MLPVPIELRDHRRGTEEVTIELEGYVHPPDEDSTAPYYTALNALESAEGSYPAAPEYRFTPAPSREYSYTREDSADSDQSQDSAGLSLD